MIVRSCDSSLLLSVPVNIYSCNHMNVSACLGMLSFVYPQCKVIISWARFSMLINIPAMACLKFRNVVMIFILLVLCTQAKMMSVLLLWVYFHVGQADHGKIEPTTLEQAFQGSQARFPPRSNTFSWCWYRPLNSINTGTITPVYGQIFGWIQDGGNWCTITMKVVNRLNVYFLSYFALFL